MEVDLLAMVLAYMSLVIVDHKLWNSQGNTIEDGRAWMMRVLSAATGGNPETVGRALGVEPADIRKLQDHWRTRLHEPLV